MGRNLVLCLDGTSNQFSAANTNVVKLYGMLDRTRDDQLSYYQPGIGTFTPPGFWGHIKSWAVKEIDLAVAWFLSTHVTDAYRFLMRYHQQDDSIYIFGFSRGAYTARAVAGMLHKVGLLTQGNEELIQFAWDKYKNEQNAEIVQGFKQTFCRPVRIHFLGLWDTVSSVGWIWDPQHLPYTRSNPSVDIVRHLVALDERRAYFVQNLWGTGPEDEPRDVEQLWFPGVHCDVGGGYKEDLSGLSALALQWMTEKAEAAGLLVDQKMKQTVLPAQNAAGAKYAAPFAGGPANESLKGFWWVPEFLPKPYRNPATNYEKRWMLHHGRPRYAAPGSPVHPSVQDRMNMLSGYRPSNLPQPPQP